MRFFEGRKPEVYIHGAKLRRDKKTGKRLWGLTLIITLDVQDVLQCDVAARLGAFIADVGSIGFAEAAAKLGLSELSGKTVSEILLVLLDRLGGNSSTIDEADARQALSDLQQDLFAEATDTKDLETILLSAAHNLEIILETFFGYYIFEQFSRICFERLVQRVGALKATGFLNQIREFIQSALANRAADKALSKVNWAGADGAAIVSQILDQTLEVFGA
jgi:hypothetical protein